MIRPGIAGSLDPRIVAYKRCVARIVVCCMVVPFLSACTGKEPTVTQSPKATNGPMSDPITELQPLAKTPNTPSAPVTPAVTETQLGIPFYPGAMPVGADAVQETSSQGTGMAITVLQTRDSVDKVVAFYMEKLKQPGEDGKPEPPTRRDSVKDGKPAITVLQTVGHTVKAAEIVQDDNRTLIELMHMDVPASASGSLPNGIGAPAGGPGTTSPAGAGGGTQGMPGTNPPSSSPDGNAQPPGLKYP